MLKKFYLILFSISLASASVIAQSKSSSEENELRDKIARFAPTVITADLKNLSPNDRKALDKIIAAARLFDPLFIRQVWSGNEALQAKLLSPGHERDGPRAEEEGIGWLKEDAGRDQRDEKERDRATAIERNLRLPGHDTEQQEGEVSGPVGLRFG